MKYILFLKDLELINREETKKLLSSISNDYEPIWLSDKIDLDEIRNDVEIIVAREHKVEETLLDDFPNLKTLSLAFTGYDEANVPYFVSKGINVYYVPDYAVSSVAELNVALALALLRKIPQADRAIRNRSSEYDEIFYPGTELSNKTVGIFGTGKIGIRTAELFRAFNCPIIGFGGEEKKEFIEIGGKYKSSKEELILEADIIILSLPLKSETRHFISNAELKLMKEGKILINASRSELIDEVALLQTLESKKIFVGLDVTKDAENIGVRLSKMENVILTPHIGFKTYEALKRLAIITITNIIYSLRNYETNRLNEIIKKKKIL